MCYHAPAMHLTFPKHSTGFCMLGRRVRDRLCLSWEIKAMLLNHTAVPYLPDNHKVMPYLPDSHKVIPYLPDNELLQVGLQAIRLVQYGGTSVSLHLKGAHLRGILPHHWVVPLQVVMLSLHHRTYCLAAVTRHAEVQITASLQWTLKSHCLSAVTRHAHGQITASCNGV